MTDEESGDKYELAQEIENTLSKYGYGDNTRVTVEDYYDTKTVEVYGEYSKNQEQNGGGDAV